MVPVGLAAGRGEGGFLMPRLPGSGPHRKSSAQTNSSLTSTSLVHHLTGAKAQDARVIHAESISHVLEHMY